MPPDDRNLSDDEWKEIGREYLDEMGFAGCQYAIYRHNNTEHDHVHLIANRIRPDSKANLLHWDYVQSDVAIRKLEEKYNLEVVPSSNQVKIFRRLQSLSTQKVSNPNFTLTLESSEQNTEDDNLELKSKSNIGLIEIIPTCSESIRNHYRAKVNIKVDNQLTGEFNQLVGNDGNFIESEPEPESEQEQEYPNERFYDQTSVDNKEDESMEETQIINDEATTQNLFIHQTDELETKKKIEDKLKLNKSIIDNEDVNPENDNKSEPVDRQSSENDSNDSISLKEKQRMEGCEKVYDILMKTFPSLNPSLNPTEHKTTEISPEVSPELKPEVSPELSPQLTPEQAHLIGKAITFDLNKHDKSKKFLLDNNLENKTEPTVLYDRKNRIIQIESENNETLLKLQQNLETDKWEVQGKVSQSMVDYYPTF
nr:relaxase/mobilization nuclease domain-containing protein [Lyngbya sp. PCC 8106]